MRLILYALALFLIIPGLSFAQMDQMDQMDQAQATQQMTYNATVQQGCPVRVGMPASADVLVNGNLAIRVPASAGGMTAMERAQEIANRLNAAFAEGADWNNMRVGQVGDNWVVALNGRTIATADANSARVYRTSEGQLASRWAQQTVVAMGGQPTTIAAQLRPLPVQVAGAAQEIGVQPGMMWTTATTRTVPLINAADSNVVGSIMVAGPQAQLNRVNSVVVYQSTSPEGAMVTTFVPVTTSTVSDTMDRVVMVGVVSVPTTMVNLTNLATGTSVMDMVTQNATTWNTAITAGLPRANLRPVGSTKVVPMYSMQMGQVVGAAQVVGSAQAVADTQAVIVNTNGDMLRLSATSSPMPITGQPQMQNNVVVASVITVPATMPGTGMTTQPDTMTPGTGTTEMSPDMETPDTTPPSPPMTEDEGTTP